LARTAVIVALACAGALAQERTGDAVSRGRARAKRVLREQDTSGFQIRGRVIIGAEEEGGPAPTILQVRIVGRREKGVTRVMHQILWPPALKGLAVVFEQTRSAAIKGFLFEPPERVTPLTRPLMATFFAGTGLTLEDLAENFWLWARQQVVGEGHAGDQACTILESRAAPEDDSAYASVRSCISLKKTTPLWIEKRGADGKLIKRIAFEPPDRKSGDPSFRAAMAVECGIPARRTRVEILKSERGIAISPSEFTIERLKSLTVKQPAQEP
jgi:hypothetical protein